MSATCGSSPPRAGCTVGPARSGSTAAPPPTSPSLPADRSSSTGSPAVVGRPQAQRPATASGRCARASGGHGEALVDGVGGAAAVACWRRPTWCCPRAAPRATALRSARCAARAPMPSARRRRGVGAAAVDPGPPPPRCRRAGPAPASRARCGWRSRPTRTRGVATCATTSRACSGQVLSAATDDPALRRRIVLGEEVLVVPVPTSTRVASTARRRPRR